MPDLPDLGASGWTLLALVLVLAVSFDFINGFHDTANAIATVVATRVLTPLQAILMAGILNFLGAVSGAAVAEAGAAAPKWDAVLRTVVVPLFASPVVGFLLAAGVMLLLMRGFFHS